MLTLEQIAALSATPIEPVYLCPVCLKHHTSAEAAAECVKTTEQPVAKPGDLVVIGNGYAWYNGPEDWLYDKNGYKFHGRETLRFWFVVTAVTQYPSRGFPCKEGDSQLHKLVYHVQTLGILDSGPLAEGLRGWTLLKSHIPWTLPDRDPPQSVIDAAAKMVGQTFSNLL